MHINPFSWLRRQAAEAVVLGTADGLRAVTPDGQDPPADVGELRAMLAAAVQQPKAIAAPKAEAVEQESEPAKGGRKK